jgi:hypothetical protein
MQAALQLVGKRPGCRQLFQLTAVCILIYLTDSISGRTFLVDTIAAVSVFPHKGPPPTAECCLSGPDIKPILSWGNITNKLCFGGQIFSCTFVLAAVSRPILGVNFLACHKLLVDAAARRVRRFRLKNFFASQQNEAKRDPFRFVFACSSENKGAIFSLVFGSFRFEFFVSL